MRTARKPKRKSKPKLSPFLVVPDLHAPYEDKRAFALLMQVARFLKPELLVCIGDLADFYSVSAHDKSPDRAHRFAEELEAAHDVLDQLDSLGATDKLYIEGNHEDRLRRYLMKSPELHGVVTTSSLLNLKKRGWEFVPYQRHGKRGACHFTHDVGNAGRYSVYKALDAYQHTVITGHSHRMGYTVEGTATGEAKLSASFGWLGDVEQVDYMNLNNAKRNWCLGFGYGYLEPQTGHVFVVPVPLVGYRCVVNGQLFQG